jgi:hypothetical protein
MPKAEQVNSTETTESAPVPNNRDDFLMENYLLQKCAAWHVHRAQQRLHWAQRDLDELQGNDTGDLDLNSLELMKEIEEDLRSWEPKTPGGAISSWESSSRYSATHRKSRVNILGRVRCSTI